MWSTAGQSYADEIDKILNALPQIILVVRIMLIHITLQHAPQVKPHTFTSDKQGSNYFLLIIPSPHTHTLSLSLYTKQKTVCSVS
jgi:hypothetical protein